MAGSSTVEGGTGKEAALEYCPHSTIMASEVINNYRLTWMLPAHNKQKFTSCGGAEGCRECILQRQGIGMFVSDGYYAMGDGMFLSVALYVLRGAAVCINIFDLFCWV